MQKASRAYEAVLRERVKSSRVYREYQSTGLELAELLHDTKKKPLYIRLAKTYPRQLLMVLAKDVASRRGVKNHGAYFMWLLQKSGRKPRPVPRARPRAVQLSLPLRRRKRRPKTNGVRSRK